MEDYHRSNKSSGDCGNHRAEDHPRTTTDQHLGLANERVLKRPYAGGVRNDWTKSFLNYQAGSGDSGGNGARSAGLTGWAFSVRLPRIPEERELANTCKFEAAGTEGKKGKDIVLVNGDGKGVVTATEELVKDLKGRFSLEELPDASAQLADDHHDDDPGYKRRRRLMLNKLSARRCRRRKLQLVTDMVEMVKKLEVEIEVMKTQIKSHEARQKILRMENSMMMSQISTLEKCAQLSRFGIDEMRAEIQRLKAAQQEWMQRGATAQLALVAPTNYHWLDLQQEALAMLPDPALPSATSASSGASNGGGSRLPDLAMPVAAEEAASSNADDPMEA